MSLPQQQEQQQGLPVGYYPQSDTVVQPSGHSKGSFGPVFIVLSVIIVLAMVACFLGRLCSRRYSKPKPKQGPVYRTKGDIEDSFEINIGRPKVPHGPKNAGSNSERKESKAADNGGGIKGEAKSGPS